MNSYEYVEMNGCERLLDKISSSTVITPWGDNREQNLEIVKEFLAFHYKELKDKQ